jgi:hypothetical protein
MFEWKRLWLAEREGERAGRARCLAARAREGPRAGSASTYDSAEAGRRHEAGGARRVWCGGPSDEAKIKKREERREK